MRTRDVFGLLAAAFVLVMSAAAIGSGRLWCSPGTATVPWLLSDLAIGLVVVVALCVLTGYSPTELPKLLSIVATAALSIAVALGMGFCAMDHGPSNGEYWVRTVGEWVGFTITLGLLFWIPKIAARSRRAR